MGNEFEPLKGGEVVSVNSSAQLGIKHSTFRTSEFTSAIQEGLKQSGYVHSSAQNQWFSEDGLQCEVLRYNTAGWEKGVVRLTLEFRPLEPGETIEELAPVSESPSLEPEEIEESLVEESLELDTEIEPEASLDDGFDDLAESEEIDMETDSFGDEEDSLDLGTDSSDADLFGEEGSEEALDLAADSFGDEEDSLDLGTDSSDADLFGEESSGEALDLAADPFGDEEDSLELGTDSSGTDLFGDDDNLELNTAETVLEPEPELWGEEETELDLGTDESFSGDLELEADPFGETDNSTDNDNSLELGDISVEIDDELDFGDTDTPQDNNDLELDDLSDGLEDDFDLTSVGSDDDFDLGSLDSGDGEESNDDAVFDDVWQDIEGQ